MATKLEIFNSVYVKLGASIVQDTAEDNKRNNILNTVYDRIKNKELREHPWNFAIKRATLKPNASVPAFEFYSAYNLPSDNLKVLELDYDYKYAIEGKLLVTEEGLVQVGNDEVEVGSTNKILNATNHEAMVNDIIILNGQRKVVSSITTNTITVTGQFSATPTAGDIFEIERPAEMSIKYIAQVDEEDFTDDFAECLAWILAAETCYSIVQNQELANNTLSKAEQMKRNARSMDAQEGTPIEVTDEQFIQVRV